MNYVRQHWSGKLPLAIAFWVNVFLLSILVRSLGIWIGEYPPVEHPVTYARIAIAYLVISVFIVYPWQLIGVWRSAERYSKQPNSGVWGGVVRVLMVVGMLGTAGNLSISLPVYGDLFRVGFVPDDYSDYTISVTSDGSLLHLKGGLGFGVSEDFQKILTDNDGIVGVILDSRGGRTYEGRELANLILANDLDTYSISGCYSACGTAFIAGDRRYLATGANLAFHQYRAPGSASSLYFERGTEQEKDLVIYRSRGIDEQFLERIFLADEDDLWYPTLDELIESGVVDEFVNPSDVTAANYGEFESNDLLDGISQLSAFNSIKQYEPEIYAALMQELEQKIRAGASAIELQVALSPYVETVAGRALHSTSNRAVIGFMEETMLLLGKLEAIEPIYCLQNLFPEQYGRVDVMKHVSQEDMSPMMDALGRVISDRYELPIEEIDAVAADKLIEDVLDKMGESVKYLDAPKLNNREEYSAACNAVLKFYDLILMEENDTAANALRYIFSP